MPAKYSVEVAKDSGCRRFIALEIEGVSAVESPLWLRRRLFSVDAGVRNLLVDLSNYVMHDIGQPNHAYDADSLSGGALSIRKAADGEKLLALDGVERKLCAEDIVIADSKQAVALGGVIGGDSTAVSDSTTRLLLESANFDPVCVRKTCKVHQLRTDASNRFEKSLSPYAPPLGIQRYFELLVELMPGAKAAGAAVDTCLVRPAPVKIELSAAYVAERLGVDIDEKKCLEILGGLGFESEKKSAGGKTLNLSVPYYRATRDVSIAEDLVEEVGRIYGYEHIPEAAPRIESIPSVLLPIVELENGARDTLSTLGFSETYNYSFMSGSRAEKLGYSLASAVELENPVDANYSFVRTTLVPGMLEFVENNSRHQDSLFMYEIGRAYEAKLPKPHKQLRALSPAKNSKGNAGFERRMLVLCYASGKDESRLGEALEPPLSTGADFYGAAAALKRVVRNLGQDEIELKPLAEASAAAGNEASSGISAWDYLSPAAWMHPCRAASIFMNKQAVGVIAEAAPSVFDDCKLRVVVAEVDLALLLEAAEKQDAFLALPKYPESLFELSIVAPRKAVFSDIRALLETNVHQDLLRKIEVVNVYEGSPLQEGQKSVSVKLHFGAMDRTLASDELTSIQENLINAVEDSEYELRA